MCNELHSSFLQSKLFSQSFGELTRCSQNMSCGQSEVSKCLAYRHILKSIVKKLQEKNQNSVFLDFEQTLIKFVVHIQSAALHTPDKDASQ